MNEPRKQAVITGSSKRIGREFSLYLAQIGYDLVLHYNSSKDELDSLLKDLTQKYPNQLFFPKQFNLENWQEAKGFFNDLPQEFQNLSLLINNSSIYTPLSIMQTEPKQLTQNFAVHCFAPYLLIQAYAKKYNGGLIVNMIDSAIERHSVTHVPYLLSKRALADLTYLAAVELAPAIRVNGISPGPVLPVAGDSTDRFKRIVESTPLKKPVSISGILSTLKFFMENENVTGQIINVDSGSHLGFGK